MASDIVTLLKNIYKKLPQGPEKQHIKKEIKRLGGEVEQEIEILQKEDRQNKMIITIKIPYLNEERVELTQNQNTLKLITPKGKEEINHTIHEDYVDKIEKTYNNQILDVKLHKAQKELNY